jgi:hypothetical protein
MENIEDFLISEMTTMAETFVRQRVAALKARKIEASGALAQSLEYEIVRQANTQAVAMLLSFQDYGRFIDMRTLKPPTDFGNPYITLLEEWIRKRGWEQKFIRKFMLSRKLRTVPKNVLNQIAWGIAIKRSEGKYRRQKWYNGSKTAFISQTFNQIIAGLPDIVSNTFVETFNEFNSIKGVRFDK